MGTSNRDNHSFFTLIIFLWCIANTIHKHFNDIHIVIKLTFHISEFFSYLNKIIFALHNEVINITV